jgi:hypothetical protein
MRLIPAACGLLLLFPVAALAGAPPVDQDGRPRIKKLGTIDVDKVENAPIVFGGKLYRCEWYRNKGCFHFVEHDTGRTTPQFAQGWCFANAFVAGDTVYVTGTQHGPKVQMLLAGILLCSGGGGIRGERKPAGDRPDGEECQEQPHGSRPFQRLACGSLGRSFWTLAAAKPPQ